ncbi:MAG: hypothetical protein ABIR56_00280, partial [Polaromonas sp.]
MEGVTLFKPSCHLAQMGIAEAAIYLIANSADEARPIEHLRYTGQFLTGQESTSSGFGRLFAAKLLPSKKSCRPPSIVVTVMLMVLFLLGFLLLALILFAVPVPVFMFYI